MEVGQYPLIPKQAFLFFPSEEEICQVRNEKPYRIIFEGGVPFTGFEKEKLIELHNQIKKDKQHHQIAYMPQCTMVRFLQATKYDVEDCIEELHKYKKWEDAIYPLTLKPEIELLLKKGFFYLVGRDCNYRPIIVVNVQKLHQADLKQKIFYEVLGYFFQYIVQNCFIEGQVETWITIVDLAKMGLFSLGGIVIDTIKFLSSHFKCRLHHNYLVNCPGSMTFLFGMIKKVLKEDQIAKISLTEQSELPQRAFFSLYPDQIEEKYGGIHPNITQFWPIKCNHRVPTLEQESRLISVAEYSHMHYHGLLSLKKISKPLLEEFQARKQMCKLQKKLSKKLSSELTEKKEEESDISWEQAPEIGQIPSPFSLCDFFQNPLKQTTTNKRSNLSCY